MSSGGHNETSNQSLKRLSRLVVLAIALPFVLNACSDKTQAPESPEAVVGRIQPVAGHAMESAGSATAQPKTGEEVYAAQCASCHKEGVVGAPKFGDAAAWGPRNKSGYEALVASALKGKGSMSAQGGGSFSDLEVARAVAYLANSGGAKFEAPKAPEAAAPAAGAAATTAAAPAGGDGKALYESTCKTCHDAGVAGAPKQGDKAAWAPRIKSGMPALIASVTAGKGAMPPKGGKADASEADIKAVVEYMVNASK